MKACPLCKRTYDDWIDFCFNDGMPLVAPAAVSSLPGESTDSVLDAPEAPRLFVGAGGGAGAPVTDGMDVPTARIPGVDSADAPARASVPAETRLQVGAGGFEVRAHRASGQSPGSVDSAALEDVAAALGGTSTPPPLGHMPVPSGFGLPSPGSPTPPRPVLAPADVPDPFPPDLPTSGWGRVFSPLAFGGVVFAAFAVAGLIWLFIRPPTPVFSSTTRVEAVQALPPPTPPSGVDPVTASPPAPVDGALAGVDAPAPIEPTPPVVTPVPTAPAPTQSPTAAVAPVPTATPVPGDGLADAAPRPRVEPVRPDPVRPTTGSLRVATDPEGAQVYVDDAAVGTSPLSLSLPFGTHRVRVEHEGFKTDVRDVDLRVAEVSVPFTLKAEVVTGQVNVYGPMGFRVTVDGHDMGLMPVTVQVSEGVRQFKLTGESGESCTIPREIRFRSPGRPETVTLQCQ